MRYLVTQPTSEKYYPTRLSTNWLRERGFSPFFFPLFFFIRPLWRREASGREFTQTLSSTTGGNSAWNTLFLQELSKKYQLVPAGPQGWSTALYSRMYILPHTTSLSHHDYRSFCQIEVRQRLPRLLPLRVIKSC